MAAPAAIEVGRVGVRALPLTSKFRRELLGELRKIEKTVGFKVPVREARVYRESIRRSIQSQLREMDGMVVKVRANVDVDKIREGLDEATKRDPVSLGVTIDSVMVRRLRADIDNAMKRIEPLLNVSVNDDEVRHKIDAMRLDFERLSGELADGVMSAADAAMLRERLNRVKEHMDEIARDREARIDANPFTSWASARLAWLTRPRTVEIIPRVSAVALKKVGTALAALSGARLSWDYLDRFSTWMSEVDKKLPSLTFGVTGLATAFAGIMGSISGLVGIGDGLAATLPSLLLLPGLFAGAAMSGVALFVALKHSKDELAVLGDSYNNLGRIIRKAFWEDARPAIIEFSNSIMPQLERSFQRTSAAMGDFTAKLAGSLGREFAGGRLEAMFDGLTAAWAELATGTDAFAGAITNLGLVAARYMPRIARWFVRQSITFDNWLSQVATDGRLDQWLQESIDAFYALWDVMAATTGIFQGIWKAAEEGGSGGLRGFADMLLNWERAVNGSRWQTTLVAMFRGANTALDGFGEGLERVGLMLHAQSAEIEYFVGRSGEVLGSFVGAVADALARPLVGQGMRDFIDGVAEGLESLEDVMPELGDLFGELAGFAGDLAKNIGPVLSKALEITVPLIRDMVGALEPLLPLMSEALLDGLEKLAPILADIGEEILPILPDLVELAAEAIPILVTLVDAIKPLLIGDEDEGGGLLGILSDRITRMSDQFELINGLLELIDGLKNGDGRWEAIEGFKESLEGNQFGEFILRLMEGAGVIGEVLDRIKAPFVRIGDFFAGIGGRLGSLGSEMIGRLHAGLEAKFPGITQFFRGLPGRILETLANAGDWLYESGRSVIRGFAKGIRSMVDNAKKAASWVLEQIRKLFPFSPAKEGPFSGRGWVSFSGESVGEAFGASMVESIRDARRLISGALGGVQSEFSSMSGTNLSLGVEMSRDQVRGLTASFAGNSAGASSDAAVLPGTGNTVNFTVVNPVVRDGFEDDWNDAQGKGFGF